MAVYYKPQSPIQSGEDFIYPITTADQVKVDKDTRLNAVGVYLKNIDNSTDTTVYGNNATTLGGVAAEDYALKTDTAPDSSKLGGKAPEYYLQPRNLLDNSDFRNPVNQRGNTEITGDWNYGIDRWLVSTKYEQNPNGSILITDNGLSMGYWTDMLQLIPFEQIKGKTLTFAVCTENGVYAYTMTLPESAPPAGSGPIFVGDGIWNDIIVMESIKYDNNDSVMFRFRNARTTNQLVYWAALYEGSYTADTLPPYVPKGYAAELAECRLYYRTGTERIARPFTSGNLAYLCEVSYEIPMRANPNVSIKNIRYWASQSDAGISAIKNVGDRFGFNSIVLSSSASDNIIQFDYESTADL